MQDPHELVEIHRGIGSSAIADTLRSVLESEGITCIINSDLGAATASLGLSVGTFRVFVQREDAPRALEVLRSVDGLPDDEEPDEEEDPGPMSLRQRAHYNRTRRNAPAPGPVIGGLALVLLLLGLADLWQGWGATWLLLGLSAFAFLVALRSRDG